MKFPALMYHAIPTDVEPGKFDVRYDDFARQIDWLVANGYKSIDLYHPESAFDGKRVLITFDDGHISNLRAAEYLAQKGLVGVFYVVKDYAETSADFLNVTQIKRLAEMGHTIGIHGKDHDWWTKKTIEKLIGEITETKHWLESIIGQKVITCSAPGGRISTSVIRSLRWQIPELQYIRDSAPYMNNMQGSLHAVAVKSSTSMPLFKLILKHNIMYYFREQLVYTLKEIVKCVIYRKSLKST